MIDPTNTEPIPVHTPHTRRVLSVLVIIVLAIVAVVLVLRDVGFNPFTFGAPVVSPPTEGESIFPEDVQAEFTAIRARMESGEVSQGEGERLMTELFRRTVPSTPAE